MGKITAFCSKNTTEFSEISRWRWSECWGGDSPARHCRFVPATVKTVPANVGERHAAPGDALAVRTNRRQNGSSLRFVIARRPQADVAISGRQLRFRRKCPVIHPGSARLHPKGTSSRFAPRAPRRFAPRNDTSGWCRGAPAPLRGLMLLHKAVTDRHAGWQCCGIDSLARGSLNCHCEEAAGRRGNLGKAVTFSPKMSCYPPRFCEIATGAKRPRNDKSGDFTVLTIAGTGRKCAAGRGQPGPYKAFSIPQILCTGPVQCAEVSCSQIFARFFRTSPVQNALFFPQPHVHGRALGFQGLRDFCT